MKNNIIKISFIFSTLFCQVVSASENGQSDNGQNEVDVTSVPVFYYRPASENYTEDRPLTPAQGTDAEMAHAALQAAVDSEDVTINPGDTVNLTVDRQTGNIFVDVTYHDRNGNFVSAMVDRIYDGSN